MRHGLAILVVIAMVAAASNAQTFYPTQDTFLRFDGGYTTTSYTVPGYPTLDTGGSSSVQAWPCGNMPSKRAGKGYQDQFIMDFNRGAILANASALLGHTATAADFTSGKVVMTLSLMAAGNGFNHAAEYWPAYFTSTTAATFGPNGYNNYATYNYANASTLTLWNNGVNDSALGVDRSWLRPDETWAFAPSGGPNYTRQDCPTYYNAASTGIVWAAPDYTFQAFPYDGATAAGYLFSPLNAYLEPYMNKDDDNNGFCYSMEQAGASPYVTLALGVTKYIHAHDGDTNNDGACNVVDLGVLAKYYDSTGLPTSAVDPFGTGSWQKADFNNDGNVNVVDLGVLAKNYDWVGLPAVPTPEPMTLTLLCAGGLALIRRR